MNCGWTFCWRCWRAERDAGGEQSFLLLARALSRDVYVRARFQ